MSYEFHGGTVPSTASIEYLLAYIVHNKEVRSAALANLKPNLFNYENERLYSAFIEVLFKHLSINNESPPKEVFECDLISTMEASSSFSSSDLKAANDLISWIYDSVSKEHLQSNTNHGLELLKVFLIDRIRRDLQQTVSDYLAPQTNVELPSIISEIERRLSEVSCITDVPDGEIRPEKWIEPEREPFLVGIPFIDSYTITYPGDVNVILGVTGIGKSTLALQILTYAAKREFYNSKDPGWVAYFGYEDTIAAASKKIISCAAKIKRERLEVIKSIDELSDKNNLQPYELEFFRRNPYVDRQGEKERYLKAIEFIKNCIRVYNCSGVRVGDEKPLGNGGLEEIKYMLTASMNRIKRPLRLVVIDWAGMLVRRYLQSKGKFSDKNVILELESFVDRVYQQIALPMKCVVFVVHQLKGSISKQPPTTQVSHSDAAWCSNFAVNAWNVICFGPKDPETGAFTLSWTKTRRGKGKRNLICRMDDNFWQILSDDSFYIDSITRRIVSKSEESVYGEEKATKEI